MATRLQKMFWSILCGTALGLGATGCYDSDDQDMYGPPPDTSSDSDDVVTDEESEVIAAYGPAPMYGPEPSP
jgi:hypothetical protein